MGIGTEINWGHTINGKKGTYPMLKAFPFVELKIATKSREDL